MSDPEIILTVRNGTVTITREIPYLVWRLGKIPGAVVEFEIEEMLRQLRGRQAAGRDFKTTAQGFDPPAPETDTDP